MYCDWHWNAINTLFIIRFAIRRRLRNNQVSFNTVITHIFLPWTTQILHRTAKISFVCEASRTYLKSAAGNYCWWIKPTAFRDRGLAERAARAERRQNIRDLPKTIRGLRPPIKLQKNCPGTKKNCPFLLLTIRLFSALLVQLELCSSGDGSFWNLLLNQSPSLSQNPKRKLLHFFPYDNWTNETTTIAYILLRVRVRAQDQHG